MGIFALKLFNDNFVNKLMRIVKNLIVSKRGDSWETKNKINEKQNYIPCFFFVCFRLKYFKELK